MRACMVPRRRVAGPPPHPKPSQASRPRPSFVLAHENRVTVDVPHCITGPSSQQAVTRHPRHCRRLFCNLGARVFEEHTGANSGVELKGFQHCRTSDVDDFSQVLTWGPMSTLLLGFGSGSSSCYCYYGVFTDPDHPKEHTGKPRAGRGRG